MIPYHSKSCLLLSSSIRCVIDDTPEKPKGNLHKNEHNDKCAKEYKTCAVCKLFTHKTVATINTGDLFHVQIRFRND